MMRVLFKTTSVAFLLKYNKVFLSLPDFVQTTDFALQHIGSLVKSAGLDSCGGRHRSHTQAALLTFYQLQNCHGIHINETHQVPDLECENYKGRSIQTVLGIQLDSDFFGLRLMARDDGMFFTTATMTESHFDKGVTSLQHTEDPREYWEWVKRRILHFSQHEGSPIDLLALHGTQATRPEFLDLIRESFAENDKIKPEDYLRSADEQAYATARGVAQIAKVGMWHDFDACIPHPACPVSGHMPWELRWHRSEDEEGIEVKQEL